MKSSVILPTYNEKDNIVELTQAIFDALQGMDFEVVVGNPGRVIKSNEALMPSGSIK